MTSYSCTTQQLNSHLLLKWSQPRLEFYDTFSVGSKYTHLLYIIKQNFEKLQVHLYNSAVMYKYDTNIYNNDT